MDIYIQSEIGICNEFMSGKGKKKESVSIIISPLKVQSEDTTIRVISGCNLWQGCHNPSCFYSKAARQLPKIKAIG